MKPTFITVFFLSTGWFAVWSIPAQADSASCSIRGEASTYFSVRFGGAEVSSVELSGPLTLKSGPTFPAGRYLALGPQNGMIQVLEKNMVVAFVSATEVQLGLLTRKGLLLSDVATCFGEEFPIEMMEENRD